MINEAMNSLTLKRNKVKLITSIAQIIKIYNNTSIKNNE